MTDYRFQDDPSWVKFKCLEIAALAQKNSLYGNTDDIIESAKKFEAHIMPQATVLEISGGKDATKKGVK